MAAPRPTWKDRFPEEVTCVRCLRLKPKEDMDRLLWCQDCVARARTRASRQGWLAGAGLTVLLALWIVFWVRPDPRLVVSGWIATVVAAFWIGGKVAREIAFGLQRFSNRKAIDAEPPSPDTTRSDPPDEGSE